eukprot:gene1655-3203_t
MSANRKLQSEVDGVLKKVKEGILFFDDIWEKVYAATQQSLKEKYEGDLKKEIKKLQRLRDQIKTWLGSNEIKDKSQLLECRKLIESKMEQFKICEKEMKTKAYSREGLARETKLDPREAEKEDKREWIGSCLDRLGEVIDSIEADVEKLANSSKKNKNKETIRRLMDNDCLDPSSIDDVKDDVEYYIEQSATDDDGQLGVTDEFDIYEILELDALPTCMPGKSDDEEGEGDGTERIPTDTTTTAATVAAVVVAVEKEKAVVADSKEAEAESGESKAAKVTAAAAAAKKTTAGITAVPATPAVVAGKAAAAVPAPARGVMSSPSAKTPPVAAVKPTAVAAKPVTTTAPSSPAVPAKTNPAAPATQQAAAAAIHARTVEKKAAASLLASPVLSSTAAPSKPDVDQSPAGKDKKPDTKEVAGAGSTSWAHAATQRTTAAATAAQQPPPASVTTPTVSILKSPPPSNPSAGPPASAASVQSAPIPPAAAVTSSGLPPRPAAATPQTSSSPSPSTLPPAATTRAPGLPPTGPSATAASSATQKPTAQESSSSTSSVPNSPLSTPSSSLTSQAPLSPNGSGTSPATSVASGGISRPPTAPLPAPMGVLPTPAANAVDMLKMSLMYAPAGENERQQQGYMPRNPYPSHPSFPTTSLPVLENPLLFEKLPMDTLFFAFYYQQGSYQQFLAARQLKKHSWRFHKKYMTWFQRHEEPKVTSDEFEEGTYVYFDYESGWCQRIKSEFKFEYCYLEDEHATAPQNDGNRGN